MNNRTFFFHICALASVAVSILTMNTGCDGETVLEAAVVVEVSAGRSHTCALLDRGALKCWGKIAVGKKGRWGDTSQDMGENLPEVSIGADDRSIVQAGGGAVFHCALLDDGNVKCWGSNEYGQLGLGDDAPHSTEEQMGAALPNVDLGEGARVGQIAVGAFHVCAVLTDGRVKCWGNNVYGALGLGDQNHRGDQAGEMGDNLPPVDLGAGAGVVQIVAGLGHTCVLLDTGIVKCWGDNGHGELGIGDYEPRGDDPGEMGDELPAVDLGDVQVARIFSGSAHNCAVLTDGKIKCWGGNHFGQLGLNDPFDRGGSKDSMGDNLPVVDLGAGYRVIHMGLGIYHSCAALEGGGAKCWGGNDNGQLGLGDREWRGEGGGEEMGDNLPAVDLAGRACERITAGERHSCALFAGGAMACWGQNDDGQLGRGNTYDYGTIPSHMGGDLESIDLGN